MTFPKRIMRKNRTGPFSCMYVRSALEAMQFGEGHLLGARVIDRELRRTNTNRSLLWATFTIAFSGLLEQVV